jgi:hypothetical protein
MMQTIQPSATKKPLIQYDDNNSSIGSLNSGSPRMRQPVKVVKREGTKEDKQAEK